MVWNDPVNLMSYVTYVFQKLFGYSREQATKLMLDVHHKGRAIVSSGRRRRWRATWRSCTPPACGRPCSRSREPLGADGRAMRRRPSIDGQEAAVLRGLVSQIRRDATRPGREAPQDELAELTGIRTGPSTAPDDPILARLLPDFHRLDDDRRPRRTSTRPRPALAARAGAARPQDRGGRCGAGHLPAGGGRVRLTVEQAEAWLSAINDVRLALGTALEVTEDMPDELPDDDPRAPHLGVYHWLTWVQESLVQRWPVT